VVDACWQNAIVPKRPKFTTRVRVNERVGEQYPEMSGFWNKLQDLGFEFGLLWGEFVHHCW
jgi:hypothetical protein